MRQIAAPQLDGVVLLRSVRARRRDLATRLRLQAVEPAVLAAYSDYKRADGDVTQLSALHTDDPTGKDLFTNYDSMGGTHPEVREELLLAAPYGRCPLCSDRQVSTLDHYLPRSDYPEFSVLPLNLIPCCRDCNFLKGTHLRDVDGRFFVHAYLDDLGAHGRFLFAEATIDELGPDVAFQVVPPPETDAHDANCLKRHFQKLDLADHYRRRAVEDALAVALDVEELLGRGASPGEVAEILHDQAVSVERVFGPNYWRYAMLEALSASVEFCSGASTGESGR